MWFKKKKKQEAKFDRDANLLSMVKSANLTAFVMGMDDCSTFEQLTKETAEIEQRMAERRVAELERQVFGINER